MPMQLPPATRRGRLPLLSFPIPFDFFAGPFHTTIAFSFRFSFLDNKISMLFPFSSFFLLKVFGFRMTWIKLASLALVVGLVSAGISKNEDLECMFLGYPDLEYDGFDRTEVRIKKLIFKIFLTDVAQ